MLDDVICCIVHGEFHHAECFVTFLWCVCTVCSQHLLNCAIHSFCLSIRLWMECGSVALVKAHEVAYLFEEMPIESGISVMDDVEG